MFTAIPLYADRPQPDAPIHGLDVMRICMVAHTVMLGDGQGSVNYQIVKAALQAGHLVTMVTQNCDEKLMMHPRAKVIRFPSPSFPTILLRRLHFAMKASKWLRINRSAFDVINGSGVVVWEPVDVLSVHFVNTAWMKSRYYTYRGVSIRPHHWYQWLNTLISRVLEPFAFQMATRIVAVAPKIKVEVQDVGVLAQKIIVIKNGVDCSLFQPRKVQGSIAGVPANASVFLFVGDIKTSRKNLDTVLWAMVQLPTVHLVIAGAVKGSVYPKMVKALGISNRIHFLGKVRDVPALFNLVRGLVFPSRYEAMALVLLEAMSSGVPVITASTAGPTGLNIDPEFILRDPDDVDGLTAMIRRLAESETLAIEIGRRNRETALLHTWDATTAKYLDLFSKIAQAKWNAREIV